MVVNDKTVGDQELLGSWFATIGFITMFWSEAERSIDLCVHLIYKANGFSDSKKKPTRLGSKIETIKDKSPGSIIESGELESLIKLTKSTVQIRDVFVHGVIESYDRDKMTINKVDGRSLDHKLERFTVDRDRLNKSAKNLQFIVQQWSHVANGLLELSPNG